ncbi:NAD(P)-dependent oxidoreductase [Microbispora siamensis]
MPGSPDTLTLVCVPPDLRARLFGRELGEARLLDDPADRAGLAEALPGTEILVTGWGMPVLDAALLDLAPHLRLVAHIGASVKFFVTGEVFARGIRVTQAGQAMARPVAEVALAFTLSLLHRIHRFDHALRCSDTQHGGADWHTAEQAPPRHEILGCRVGVVGASRTGRAYLELVRALGAETVVSDPYFAGEPGVPAMPLDELLATSRIVALHAPVLPETRHLLGARELALMPDDGRFAAAGALDAGWTAGPAGLGEWTVLDNWTVLAALHDRHDDRRPLTTVRSARDWTGRVPVWYGPPHEILLLHEHGTPMAYAVVDWSAGDVVEVALAAGRAAAPLLRAVAAEARARGVRSGCLRAPLDPPIRSALPLLFEEWERRDEHTGMARPLLLEEAEVRAVVEHPLAVHWTADYF